MEENNVLTVPDYVIEEQIKLGEALTRLESNPDYKIVIQEFFEKTHVLGLVEGLSRVAAESRSGSINALMAVSHFKYMIDTIKARYDQALELKKNNGKISTDKKSNVSF